MIRSRLLGASKKRAGSFCPRLPRIRLDLSRRCMVLAKAIAVLQHLRVGHGPESAEDSGGYLTI